MQCSALSHPRIFRVCADYWHNCMRDVAVATGHAGIAGAILSDFLCLAYHCKIAVQAPVPSLEMLSCPSGSVSTADTGWSSLNYASSQR